MAKVFILYAASALHAALAENVVKPARENGQAVRLIGTEFFTKGEAETNAAAVIFVRRDPAKHIGDADKKEAEALKHGIAAADEAVYQAIVETYPDLEVGQRDESDVELPTLKAVETSSSSEEDDVKALRAKLVSLGGSVPAGSDKAKLEELIAQQEADAAKKDADAKAAADKGDKK